MLNQNDLEKQISSSDLKSYIACGSHLLDLHVKGSLDAGEIGHFNSKCRRPSGIPYKCIVPKSLTNVLIACRAYGASHIALSACRVNKDMAQLGWAAGNAIRIMLDEKLSNTRQVDVAKLQSIGYTGFACNVKTLESRIE
jgi:hypothetical protein